MFYFKMFFDSKYYYFQMHNIEDKPDYMDYLKKLPPSVRPGGLIPAHNVANAGISVTLKKRNIE